MELQLSNKLQHHIADLLWKAETQSEVNKIIATYGSDAKVVFDMMLAEHFDQISDTDLAEEILARFK